MKKRIQKLLFFSVLIFSLGSIYCLVSKKSHGISSDTNGHQVKNSFAQELEKEYQEIKKKLIAIGIQFPDEETQKQYLKKYRAENQAETHNKVSPTMQKLVNSVIQQCGLDPSNIKVVSYQGSSPAASSENSILINEKALSNLPECAKAFVIAHEVKHIHYHDNLNDFILEELYGIDIEQLLEQKNYDHPILELSRFIEKRADIEAALQNLNLAQGCYEMSKDGYLQGDITEATHPEPLERFKLAEQILDYMKNQQIA